MPYGLLAPVSDRAGTGAGTGMGVREDAGVWATDGSVSAADSPWGYLCTPTHTTVRVLHDRCYLFTAATLAHANLASLGRAVHTVVLDPALCRTVYRFTVS